MKFSSIRILAPVLLVLATVHATAAVPGIRLMDPNLDVELIDTDAEEFFVSHTMDLSGRMFLGTREALFVYERNADGGFAKRQELYRFPKNSWLYDLEVYGDDIFVLCNTALYRINGARTQRTNLKPEKLLWGAPMGHYHQGLHGMEFGPKGDLYLSIGDPQPHLHWDRDRPDHLWHWTFYVGPKNTPVTYNGVGAVLRYRLADHSLTVHTSGLRNPCGISFDPNWNLFANDNDQEGGVASPCRLVYTPQHAWAGWVRGWADRHNPKRLDMLPVANLKIDVPVGQCWYDDTVLGEQYKGSIFVANWGDRTVSQHRMSANGAGFTAPKRPLLIGDGIRRPVSVMPTNDGRLIVAVCYMQGNEGSPVRQTDLLLISPKNQTFPLKDYAKKPLTELLDAPWQLRYQAHREILRSGKGSAEANKLFQSADAAHPAIGSLIHLAAQKGDAKSKAKVQALATSKNAVQSTALRAAASAPETFKNLAVSKLHETSKDPSVLHALLEYLHAATTGPIEQALALVSHQDPYVRQSAARLLAKNSAPSDAQKWQTSTDAETRLAAAMAAGFRIWDKVEATENFPKVGYKALDKHMKHHYADGQLNLTSLGKPVGIFKLSEWWAEAPNSQANADDFSTLKAGLSDADPRVNIASAVYLFFLKDASVEADIQTILKREGIYLNGMPPKTGMKNKDRKAATRALANAKLSDETDIPPAFIGIDWNEKATSGNVEIGKKLFTNKGCIACHLAPDDGIGGSIGPSLVDAGKRFTPVYLVESILVPNRAVSPNFHPVTLTMQDGSSQVGYVESEGDGIIQLRGITGQLTPVAVVSVKKREASHQSMMPAGLIHTPEEMADMVAFLSKKSATTKAPAGKGEQETGTGKATTAATKSLTSLSDWTTTGNWKVDKDGAFILTPRPGETDWRRYGDYLWTRQPYRDFAIDFEYKHEKGGNSGLYFNVMDRQKAVGSVIEVQIRDSHGEKTLDAHDTSGGILPAATPMANAAKPAGEWNRMQVRSLNGVVTVRLNDTLVNSVTLATHPKLKNKPTQGYVGFQDHGLPFSLRRVSIRDLSATTAGSEDRSSIELQRSINPLGPNFFSFAPSKAKFVRIHVLETSQASPCIDEVEIYSSEWPDNLALAAGGAKASASSIIKGYPGKHRIENLNDGKYGLKHSWIPAQKTGWAQIELPSATSIDRVVLSSDRGGKITRRTPIAFDILVSLNGKKWTTVKKVRPSTGPKPVGQAVPADDKKKNGSRAADRNGSKVAKVIPAVDDTGFSTIFDGKSLDQWDHREGAWEIVNGTIACTGKEKARNWIIWRGGEPADFVLRLEFSYEAGNSGVQVRSDDLGDHQVFGYQVEIAPQAKMGLWHHSLLGKEDPAHGARFFMATAGEEVTITEDGKKSVKRVADAKEIVTHYQQDGWNQMEIIAEGNTLTQKINGVVFSKVTDHDKRMSRTKGFIALQDHGKGCSIAFRNIRLKRVPADK